MEKLGKKEKAELLRLASSVSLKRDLRSLKTRRIAGNTKNVDLYLKFLNVANAFAGHTQKTFRKIQGHYFKI